MSLKQIALISLCAVAVPVMAHAQHDCACCPMAAKQADAATLDSAQKGEPVYNKLPGFNKKVPIGEDYYFTYKFNKRPQISTLSLIVRVYDKGGKQVKPFDITGEYGMPSMRGAHDSGPVAFKLNRLGDYLLPVGFVMRGVWEVKLVFTDADKKPVYYGAFKLSV